MSTNKVYGDNPNKLMTIEKKKRWELKKKDKNFSGVDEKFPIDKNVTTIAIIIPAIPK